ncbi:hypothetical protein [Rubellicoccus peritrichatus]|uniref:Uncharacterized protein n=1 Tax=Rubellicoccus peritrichatus TaxID=3080537 RepID=A0AAQ3LAH7_9BACT|nr:hypothetical protein [Puniceicoccus sp. CR14]WOO39928.1 hypothetical protein RZN69_14980 [Puniceicoccus sp. CR14]
MSPPPISNPVAAKGRSGFALIISISLMAFILVMVLSLSTLVSLESATSRHRLDEQRARQNALFALQQAIGQLQAEAGPDQRITARADILPSTGANTAIWTGVWKSYDPENPDATIGEIRALNSDTPTWLVSGNNPDPSSITGETVTLASYTDHSGANQGIEVSRVPVDPASDSGGYAWLTEDESLKAKLNPKSVDQNSFGDSINESQRQFLVPQKSSMIVVSEDDWKDVTNSPEKLSQAFSLDDLGLISTTSSDSPDFSVYSSDVTLKSLGILANNRKGGLRKDLTRGLDDQYEQHLSLTPQLLAGENDDSRLLYSDTTRTTSDVDILGESWDIFYNYYNLYKFDHPRPSSVTGLPPSDDAYHQADQIKNLNSNTSSDPTLYPRADRFPGGGSNGYVKSLPTLGLEFNSYRRAPFGPIRPLMVQIKMSYGVRSIKDETDPDDVRYRFRLHVYPTFVICNPYNVRMETGSAATNPDRGPYSLYYSDQDSYSMDVGNGYQNIFGNYTTNNGIGGNIFGQLALKVPNITLEPGQVMVLGMQNSQVWPTNDSTLEVTGVSGDLIDEDASFYTDLFTSGDPDPNGQPTRIPLEATNPSDEVIFRFNQKRIRAQVDLNLPEAHSHTNVRLNAYIAEVTSDETDNSSSNGRPIFTLGTVDAIDSALPTPFVGYQMRALTPDFEFPSYAHLNLISYTSHTYMPYAGSGDAIGSFDDAIPEHDGDNAYWGGGLDAGTGTSRVILYDVPRQPMQSIGDFMHASFGFGAEDPLYIVGGSYPSPFIEKSRTFLQINGGATNDPANDAYFVDRSYYINDRIFDEYFFSTIPTAGRDASKSFPYNTSFDQDYIDEGLPLQNTRLIYNDIIGDAPALTDLQGMHAFHTAAAELFIDGPFNINSTAINAWIATLSAFRDEKLIISKVNDSFGSNNEIISASKMRNPFTRFTAPRGGPDELWTGFATLTDTEIRQLAAAIVNEIKIRGPFYSIGDFINRDPFRSNEGFATRGAIQKAIDDTSINDDISIGNSPTLTETPNAGRGIYTIYTENLAKSTAANIPGWLSQNDIIRQLAPIMTARGDTFTIKFYGDTKNEYTNDVVARAYGVAVVQRIPDYIESVTPPETHPSDLGDSDQYELLNKTFGRQFKIVGFNWLN